MPLGIYWDAREPLPPWHQHRIHDDISFRYNDFLGDDQENEFPSYRADHNSLAQNPQSSQVRHHLPPLSVSLAVDVVHDTATTTATQLFHNSSDSKIKEAKYSFPLPAGCSVTAFTCRVGRNQIIRAKIKPKEEARETFQTAVSTDLTAGLVEQNTPEVFTVQLGNIPAQTKLKAEITFVNLLTFSSSEQSNTTVLTIPTFISPRYGSLPAGFQETLSSFSYRGITIDVNIVTIEDIKVIKSHTHSITWERGLGRVAVESLDELSATDSPNDLVSAHVKLSNELTTLEKDFVLEIITSPHEHRERPQAYLEVHPTNDDSKAIMLTIPSEFGIIEDTSETAVREIVFITDLSGSMSDKIIGLVSAMKVFLKSIPLGAIFNICRFGSGHALMWPQSKQYNDASLRHALNYVLSNFKANMGGTQLLPALKAICNGANQSQTTDYIVLTDGQIWDLDEVIQFVKQTRNSSNGNSRFFSLGIGDAVSHELVEGIAKAGGGYAEVIPSASQGGWEDRVIAMLRSALKGHSGARQLKISWESEEVVIESAYGIMYGPQRPKNLQSPFTLSNLSPFLRNRVFVLLETPTQSPLDSIRLTAVRHNGEVIITEIPIVQVDGRHLLIHSLAARALLADLERRQSWVHLAPYHHPPGSLEEGILVREEGERIGCKWSLVSKWTSFVAVEEPYEIRDHLPDTFIDNENPDVTMVETEWDLLHPRDDPGSNTGVTSIGDAPVIEIESTTEDVGDSDPSDSENCDTDSQDEPDENDDSDEDSDGDDEPGAGGASGMDAGGASQDDPGNEAGEVPPRSPRSEREYRGESTTGGYSASGGGSSRSRSHLTAALPSSKIVPSPADSIHTNKNYSLKSYSSSTQSQVNDDPLAFRHGSPSDPPTRNRDYSAFVPDDSRFEDIYDVYTSLHNESFTPSIVDTSYESRTRDSSIFSKPTQKRSSSIHKSSSSFQEPPDFNDQVISPTYRRSSTEKLSPFKDSKRSKSTYESAESLSSRNLYSAAKPGLFGIGRDRKEGTVEAPSRNTPAATSMLDTKGRLPKSAKVLKEEEMVKSIIAWQDASGRFSPIIWRSVKLASKVAERLEGFAVQIAHSCYSNVELSSYSNSALDVASTFVVIQLLTEKFSLCSDLWWLVANKGWAYVESQWIPRGVSRTTLMNLSVSNQLNSWLKGIDVADFLSTQHNYRSSSTRVPRMVMQSVGSRYQFREPEAPSTILAPSESITEPVPAQGFDKRSASVSRFISPFAPSSPTSTEDVGEQQIQTATSTGASPGSRVVLDQVPLDF